MGWRRQADRARAQGPASGRGSTTAQNWTMGRIRLGGSSPRERGDGSQARSGPWLPWPLLAVGAAVLTALTGWLPPVLLAVIGWVQAPDLGFWSVLGLGTRGWLLAHGAGAELDGRALTVVPLGVTALVLFVGAALSGMVAQQARQEAAPELSQRQRRDMTLRVAVAFVISYVVCVLFGCALADTANQTGRALLGAIVLGAACSLVGAGRALDWRPTQWWPNWARAVPRAVVAGLAVMVATGALVVALALLLHRQQVVTLHDSLAAGTVGSLVILALQLAWLPNLVLWGASWALGAGFTLGTGTIVSPAHTLIGMLPAIPVLGAVGPNGPGPWPHLLWMASGILAGAVAAWEVVRQLPGARADVTSLTGGLAGVLTGACLWLLAAASNGALGDQRLAEVGARLVPLAVMAPTVMGIAGLLTGLVLGLAGPGRPAGEKEHE
ncbi:DUF6350 family protein [Luteococcus sp.]|uniref:cell division protein PerM n=1 Tax=Luteococcus sp. TaxID=1969402 RepID=UPI003735DFC7